MLMQTALTVVTVSPFFNKSLAHICICVAPACSLAPNPAFLYTNFLCEGPVVRLNVLCVRANRVVCTPGESSRAQPGLFPGSILFLFSFHSRCLVFLFCWYNLFFWYVYLFVLVVRFSHQSYLSRSNKLNGGWLGMLLMQVMLNRKDAFEGGCIVSLICVIAAAIISWVLAYFILREATAKLNQ